MSCTEMRDFVSDSSSAKFDDGQLLFFGTVVMGI